MFIDYSIDINYNQILIKYFLFYHLINNIVYLKHYMIITILLNFSLKSISIKEFFDHFT